MVDQRNYSYDLNSNMLNRATTSQTSTYQYDALGRLISDDIANADNLLFDYDLNGNRQTRQDATGDLDELLVYVPNSNRLDSRDISITGQLPDDFDDLTIQGFVYNDANRLFQYLEGGVVKAEYIYNDDGLRTRKLLFNADSTTSTTVYHYDQMGYLISETTETGELIKDYIWAEGMVP